MEQKFLAKLPKEPEEPCNPDGAFLPSMTSFLMTSRKDPPQRVMAPRLPLFSFFLSFFLIDF